MVKEKDEKEVKPPKEGEWKVNLVIVDEDKPPMKYIVKGDKTLDEPAALAKILNELEKLKGAILS